MTESVLAVTAAVWGIAMGLSPLLQIRRMRGPARAATCRCPTSWSSTSASCCGSCTALSSSNLTVALPNIVAFTVGTITIVTALRLRRATARVTPRCVGVRGTAPARAPARRGACSRCGRRGGPRRGGAARSASGSWSRWASSSYGSTSRMRSRCRTASPCSARTSARRAELAGQLDERVPGQLAGARRPSRRTGRRRRSRRGSGPRPGVSASLAGGDVAGGEQPAPVGGVAQEQLDVDLDVLAHEPHRVVVGGDVVVGRHRLARVEHAADRAQQHREPARRSVGLVGPQQRRDLLAHDRRAAPGDEQLEQVAGLARAPLADLDRSAGAG